MKPRIYRKRLQRDFRKGTVNYPKRLRVTLEEPTRYGKTTTTFTAITEREEKHQAKEANGDWETTLSYHGFTVRHSKTSDRYWVFYRDRFLTELSEIEQHELSKKWLQAVDGFSEIIQKVVNGVPYKRYTLKGEARWKSEHG
jgi:hypothetical protein